MGACVIVCTAMKSIDRRLIFLVSIVIEIITQFLNSKGIGVVRSWSDYGGSPVGSHRGIGEWGFGGLRLKFGRHRWYEVRWWARIDTQNIKFKNLHITSDRAATLANGILVDFHWNLIGANGVEVTGGMSIIHSWYQVWKFTYNTDKNYNKGVFG